MPLEMGLSHGYRYKGIFFLGRGSESPAKNTQIPSLKPQVALK
jgi:hypothetical protein